MITMTYQLHSLSEEVVSGRYRNAMQGRTPSAGIDTSQEGIFLSDEIGAGFVSHIVTHPHTAKRQYSKPKPRSPGRAR